MPSIVPLIDVDLDVRRHLRFRHEAVQAAEQTLTRIWGREYPFFEAAKGLYDFATTGDLTKLNLTNLAVLLWQGCLHEDPTLTLAMVHEAMPHIGDIPSLGRLVGNVIDAWQVGTPTPDLTQEVDPEANPLDGSIGPPSGPSLVSTSV